MFEKKIDVDRHVEYSLKKITSETERNLRSFAFAKLYFNVGENELARRYVSNYLVVKPHSAEAQLLLGKILEKLGKKEAALEAYRTSLDIDPKQNGLILKVCELLAFEDITIELSRAKYWCEQGQLLDPQNPAIFNLKEKLLTSESNSPDDVRKLYLSELAQRPTDIGLRVRLLQHMLQNNQIADAYTHVSEIERKHLTFFSNHLAWYETAAKILIRYRNDNTNNDKLTWPFWMLIINVLDKLVVLYLDENLNTIKNLSDCVSAVLNLDQTLFIAVDFIQKNCLEKQFAQEFLIHYRGQLCFHLATLVFKQAKKDQIKFKEAINLTLPLLLLAYHFQPVELQCVWLDHSSEEIKRQTQRWHKEAAYRCTQSGFVLSSIAKERKSTFVDRVSQLCTGNWREKTYKNIFITRDQQMKLKSSYFVHSPQLEEVTIRLPDTNELLKYSETAQLVNPGLIHHLIWIGLNLPPVKFRCTIFDGLQYTVRNLSNCAAETVNILDIQAFLHLCIFCTQSQIDESKHMIYFNQEKPNVLPASITESYGTLNQSKWFASVYKMFTNECGSDLSDIRVTLIKGIEIIRCCGTHGLDVKLLVMLAQTFALKAKLHTKPAEIDANEARAELYWKIALPLLEKLKNNQVITYPSKRWFEYKGKDMTPTEINIYLEEGKLFSAVQLMKKKDHEKALQLLETLKSPYASFYQAKTYKLLADDQMTHNREHVTSEMRSQHIILLSKSRDCFYLTLDRLREPSVDRKHPLNIELGTEIEKIERLLSRIDPDCANRNECDGMSDENLSNTSSLDNVNNISAYNISSTYTSFHNGNLTPRNERHEMSQSRRIEARPSPERLDAQLRQMAAAKDAAVTHILEQNRIVMDAHKTLVDEIRGFKDAVHNLTSSVDELKGIKKSVDDIKIAVDEFHCLKEQVSEIKKDLNELKKDTTKLKNNQINDEDLYALDEDYGVDYNASANFNALYPNFQQRGAAFGALGPYGMYPMYNYGGLGQPPLVFPEGQIPDYRAMGSIAQGLPGLPQAPPAGLPIFPKLPDSSFNKYDLPAVAAAAAPVLPQITPILPVIPQVLPPQIPPKAPPVNVVITASDPLPTTSVTQPPMSVTIPPQHLKSNKPHNYQIPLPVTTQPTFSQFAAASISTPMPISTQNLLVNVAAPVYSSLLVNKSPTNKGLGLQIEKSLSQSFTQESDHSIPDEHDPCPDFQPIIPLPDEVPINTGEENENVLFSDHAKLYRFVDKEWKERGIGTIKILESVAGKIRILMRRDQVHKICANHYITHDMVLTPMTKNERAYIWAANDFADEQTTLEKLCVRFKTVEAGKRFAEQFEIARSIMAAVENTKRNIELEKQASLSQSCLGGFVFTSTPSFKPPSDGKTVSETNKTTVKASPFASFTFETTKSESSVLTTPPQKLDLPPITTPVTVVQSDEPNEDFIPTAEFKPVIPLPDLIEVKTGEENSEVLYEVKAKLLRFESVNKEWKERGVGIIKILKDKTIRLIMRREQVHKVCCNHQLLKSMVFTNMPKNNRVLNWCAQDFSENVLKTEMFAIRFRTPELCEEFLATIHRAQAMLDSSNNVISGGEEKTKDIWECATCNAHNNTKMLKCSSCGMENEQPGSESPQKFTKPSPQPQDKPKLKPAGIWHCKICFIHNDGKNNYCEACDTPKNELVPKKAGAGQQFSFGTTESTTPPAWGDKFKPKTGAWECKACYISNDPTTLQCIACSTTRNLNEKKTAWECKLCSVTNEASKMHCTGCNNPIQESWVCNACFRINISSMIYCIGCNTLNQDRLRIPKEGVEYPSAIELKYTHGAPPNWGGQFKPKAGNWECKSCYISNDSSTLYCIACDSPKDSTVPAKKDKGLDLATPETQKFTFGIPPQSKEPAIGSSINQNTEPQQFGTKTDTIFGSGFNFNQSQSGFSFGQNETAASPLNLAAKNTFNFSLTKTTTGADESKDEFVFGSPNKHEFEFKARSPRKVSENAADDDDAGEIEEECDKIYFKPVIPLPDKVEVKTGEEDEAVLYCHRAKLFRYCTGEWRERGIGDIKILKHLSTGKLRVVMRREQVLKICLNHVLTKETVYTAKDERSWLFMAADYTDGEINYQNFCIRFKNAEIAQEFHKAVQDAVSNDNSTGADDTKDNDDTQDVSSANESNDDLDLEIVYEVKVTPEQEAKALALQLPKNFYAYLQKEPCPGCIGCNPDDYVFPVVEKKKTPKQKPTGATPKTTYSFTQQNVNDTTTNNSQYFTPTTTPSPLNDFLKNYLLSAKPISFDNTTPSTTEKSPLAAPKLTSNKLFTSSPMNQAASNVFGTKATDTPIQFGDVSTTPKVEPSLFEGKTPIFGGSGEHNTSKTIFGGTPIFGSTATTVTIPKIGDAPTAKPMFGGTPIFGTSTTITPVSGGDGTASKSIFGGSPVFGSSITTTAASSGDKANDGNATKSIFGGAPIFGATTPVSTVKTEDSTTPKPIFGQSSIFGTTITPISTSDSTVKPFTTTPVFGTSITPISTTKTNNSTPSTPIFGGTSIFSPATAVQVTSSDTTKSIFGGTPIFSTPKENKDNPTIFGDKNTGSIFGSTTQPSVFGGTGGGTSLFSTGGSLFGTKKEPTTPTTNVFGGGATSTSIFSSPSTIFGGAKTDTTNTHMFGSTIFGNSKINSATQSLFGKTETTGTPETPAGSDDIKSKELDPLVNCDSTLSFAALATTATPQDFTKKADDSKSFSFAGAGAPVFSSIGKKTEKTPKKSDGTPKRGDQSGADEEEEEGGNAGADEEYDPHYEPIVPLPDAIEVKTGEEDEEIIFRDRAKLYRYNVDTKEWKERGVGQLKILFNPVGGHYRFLLRREQVHKLVLNQRLTPDLELQPLQNSDRAWLWAGMNYTDEGSQLEKLAVRFKSVELAKQFYDAVEAARNFLLEKSQRQIEDEDEYEGQEDYSDDSEDNRSMMFSKRCTLSFKTKETDDWNTLGMGEIKIYYDSDLYGGRIEMFDDNSQTLSNTIIAINTVMRVDDTSCIWRAMEWALEPAVPRYLKAQFSSVAAAQEMYYNYQEALQYAQQTDIYETMPK